METSAFNIMKRIGINTLGDLEMFKRLEQRPNETTAQALKRYMEELGENFEIKGEQKNEIMAY